MTRYSFKDPYPIAIQKAVGGTVSLEAYHEDVIVAPTQSGSTYTLRDPTGSILINAQPVVVVDSIATYSIASSSLVDAEYADSYIEVWSLVMPDGRAHQKQRQVAICLYPLQMPANGMDLLLGEHKGLMELFGDDVTSLQGFLDATWGEILREIWANREWPSTMISQFSLYGPLVQGSLYRAFNNLSSRQTGGAQFLDLMRHHLANYRREKNKIQSLFDRDQDGIQEGDQMESLHKRTIHANVGRLNVFRGTHLW